jgi:hypothetical protein
MINATGTRLGRDSLEHLVAYWSYHQDEDPAEKCWDGNIVWEYADKDKVFLWRLLQDGPSLLAALRSELENS